MEVIKRIILVVVVLGQFILAVYKFVPTSKKDINNSALISQTQNIKVTSEDGKLIIRAILISINFGS